MAKNLFYWQQTFFIDKKTFLLAKTLLYWQKNCFIGNKPPLLAKKTFLLPKPFFIGKKKNWQKNLLYWEEKNLAKTPYLSHQQFPRNVYYCIYMLLIAMLCESFDNIEILNVSFLTTLKPFLFSNIAKCITEPCCWVHIL